MLVVLGTGLYVQGPKQSCGDTDLDVNWVFMSCRSILLNAEQLTKTNSPFLGKSFHIVYFHAENKHVFFSNFFTHLHICSVQRADG